MFKKREILEWMLILGILGVIYFGGWQTEVAGFLQRGILFTGLLNPDQHLSENEVQKASYNFSLVSLDGQKINPEDLRNKVVFLNIWATWCPPCIAEMPGIYELYQSVNDEEIIFVMVSVDENIDKLKLFLEKKSYTFPVYLPEDPLPEVYQTRSIPTTFVISPQGEIVFKEEGMANYNTDDFRTFLNNYVNQAKK